MAELLRLTGNPERAKKYYKKALNLDVQQMALKGMTMACHETRDSSDETYQYFEETWKIQADLTS